MEDPEKTFAENLEFKRRGGAGLEVFVSDGVWLGGQHESRSHEPFVAIAPKGWDGEEEVTFFRDPAAVDAFVEELRAASLKAFGGERK